MPKHYKFNCLNCGELNWPRYSYCPYCGIEHDVPQTKFVKEYKAKQDKVPKPKREFIKAESFQRLLSPLIELNGYRWVADIVGVDESRIRQLMNGQKTVSVDLVDRWLTSLGLTNALNDGTIDLTRTVGLRQIPEPPQVKFFEE